MQYLACLVLAILIVIAYINHKRNMELLCMVSSPHRGTRSERKLVIRLLKHGVHPKAIYHDLYLPKIHGGYSQVDLVVATPQGLVSIEVKDYSGWLFGREYQQYWTQVLNYGKEKHRFYNPIKQNSGHIRTLREQSEQLAHLPIFNVVLFTRNGRLRDIDYYGHGTYVGYTRDIMGVLNSIRGLSPAHYTDKEEVMRILRKGVYNGDDPIIVERHLRSVSRYSNDI